MRKMILLLAMLASFSFAAAPLAMAQDDVDIDAVGETVMSADIDTLIADLETPPADEALPDGFANATFVPLDEASQDAGMLTEDDLQGSEGSIAYSVDYDPTTAAGADASPEATGFAVRIASVNYIFIDEEITSDDLEDFKEGAEEGASTDEQGEATVELVEINGAEAVLMTYVLEDTGVQSVVQMYAVPVGNTMVITMIVEAGETVDADGLLADTEALTISMIGHLGETAEGGQ